MNFVGRERFDLDGELILLQTLADVEKNLLFNLDHLTVGDVAPSISAQNLSGETEKLEDYRGQTTLIDFWATWCGPCRESIPDLVVLAEELPEDQFEIVSVSVDWDVDTVIQFQDSTPMPWTNWYIGPASDILKTWAVSGYPTYILLDRQGKVVARTHYLNDDLKELIRATATQIDV